MGMDSGRRPVHCFGDRYYDAAMRIFIVQLLLLLAVAAPAAAQFEGEITAPERGRAVEIVDGDTLVLEDGLQVRLVGTQAPKLPLGRPNFQTWPLATEAKAALARLASASLPAPSRAKSVVSCSNAAVASCAT